MYFKDFPVLPYPVYVGDKRTYVLARNILRRVALTETVNDKAVFINYDLKDGERPEHVANRVYGNANHHWLILLTNEITDPYYGWYMSQTTLEQYIQKRYSGLAVYFSETASGGFTYNSYFHSGCTLNQGNNSQSIKGYRDTFCEFTVEAPVFGAGSATVSRPDGGTTDIYIQKTTPYYRAVHHFVVERPTTGEGSSGAQQFPVVDPLSKQVADYEELPPVLGTRVPPSGIGGATGATVEFWETYIGQYMGVSGDEINLYSVTNQIYEQDKNDARRTIKVLNPAFLTQALNELKAALGV